MRSFIVSTDDWGKTLETSGEDVKLKLETSGCDLKTKLETSGEDVNTKLETNGEDVKTKLETSGEAVKIISRNSTSPKLLLKSNLQKYANWIYSNLSLSKVKSIYDAKVKTANVVVVQREQ